MSIETTSGRITRVHEILDTAVPARVHPGWAADFPWLVQGTTTRGGGSRVLDFGSYSRGFSPPAVRQNWDRLLALTEMTTVVHAPQVHGACVRFHGPGSPGLRPGEPCDGHATDQRGVLLAVTVADCVPVSVVSPGVRAISMIHAGWRGVSAGILERGLQLLSERADARSADLHVHFGPAICGACYEVGPEVFAALGEPTPPSARPLDLRNVLAVRALAVGVDPTKLTISTHCTRCTDSDLFSHRGGDRSRQVGYLGVRS